MKNKNKSLSEKHKFKFNNEDEIVQQFSSSKIGVIVILALMFSILHRNHIYQLFESDRHFSHLSSLERELTFRTEMGLYYSYYKTIIEAPSFLNGMYQIMRDNVTEFPLVINTLKRFNLYPEVILGAAYRTYITVADSLNLKTKTCWTVNRGGNLSSVESCEGLGEPSYFYIEAVFLLNGINMGLIFIFSTYLSGSILGGIIACLCFFYNHGECTRVQWTPPLRENFSYPFLILQMFIVTIVLRQRIQNNCAKLLISFSTLCFMLSWQFSQFALLTQTISIFVIYIFNFVDSKTVKTIIMGQAIGLLMSMIFLFGNEMLLTSFFNASLVAFFAILYSERFFQQLNLHSILIRFFQVFLMVTITITTKLCSAKLIGLEDDKHIADIFKSKFSDFKNFHTMLYTCAAEFDFMETATPLRLTKTLLAPSCLFALSCVHYKILKDHLIFLFASKPNNVQTSTPEKTVLKSKSNNDFKNGHIGITTQSITHTQTEPLGAEHMYHLIQLCAFTSMAVIIMRLKLFWTPHLCLLTSMLASRQYFSWVGSKQRHRILLVFLIGLMTIQGWTNLQQQWAINGEFSNLEMETLVEWINSKTKIDAVFAGPMPTMATVKLCSGRPIVNHPHYEDVGLRARTKLVYSMFSRKSEAEVWNNFVSLKANYVIIEEQWCYRRSKPGCGMADIWDLEDAENRTKTPVCQRLYDTQLPYFKTVFQNSNFLVLKIIKRPIL